MLFNVLPSGQYIVLACLSRTEPHRTGGEHTGPKWLVSLCRSQLSLNALCAAKHAKNTDFLCFLLLTPTIFLCKYFKLLFIALYSWGITVVIFTRWKLQYVFTFYLTNSWFQGYEHLINWLAVANILPFTFLLEKCIQLNFKSQSQPTSWPWKHQTLMLLLLM